MRESSQLSRKEVASLVAIVLLGLCGAMAFAALLGLAGRRHRIVYETQQAQREQFLYRNCCSSKWFEVGLLSTDYYVVVRGETVKVSNEEYGYIQLCKEQQP